LGVGLRFTTEAIQDAKRGIIADAMEDAGREVSKAFDDMAIEAIFSTASAGTVAGSVNTFDGTIICGIKGTLTPSNAQATIITAATGSTITWGAVGGTATWYYVKPADVAGIVASATTSNSVSSRNLLDAKNRVISKYYEPNVAVMNDTKLADLLFDANTKFLDKSAYGTTEGLLNAEVGKVMGLKVIVTNRFPEWCILIADTTHLGYHVLKRELAMRRDDITGYNQDALFFWGWAQRTIGVMMSDAMAVAVQGSVGPALVTAVDPGTG